MAAELGISERTAKAQRAHPERHVQRRGGDFLSTERDLGVILEVFSGMPKKQTKER